MESWLRLKGVDLGYPVVLGGQVVGLLISREPRGPQACWGTEPGVRLAPSATAQAQVL